MLELDELAATSYSVRLAAGHVMLVVAVAVYVATAAGSVSIVASDEEVEDAVGVDEVALEGNDVSLSANLGYCVFVLELSSLPYLPR